MQNYRSSPENGVAKPFATNGLCADESKGFVKKGVIINGERIRGDAFEAVVVPFYIDGAIILGFGGGMS